MTPEGCNDCRGCVSALGWSCDECGRVLPPPAAELDDDDQAAELVHPFTD